MKLLGIQRPSFSLEIAGRGERTEVYWLLPRGHNTLHARLRPDQSEDDVVCESKIEMSKPRYRWYLDNFNAAAVNDDIRHFVQLFNRHCEINLKLRFHWFFQN